MTTKGDNTPTNTLREQIEDIIVDTTMHPVEQSLKIEALVSQAVNKARPTDLRIGMLRQWLNEDRITDPKKMVTNEELKVWLELETPKEKSNVSN